MIVSIVLFVCLAVAMVAGAVIFYREQHRLDTNMVSMSAQLGQEGEEMKSNLSCIARNSCKSNRDAAETVRRVDKNAREVSMTQQGVGVLEDDFHSASQFFDGRLDGVEEDVDSMSQSMEGLRTGLSGVKSIEKAIRSTVNALSKEVKELKSSKTHTEDDIDALLVKVDSLRNAQQQANGNTKNKNELKNLSTYLVQLKQEVSGMNKAIFKMSPDGGKSLVVDKLCLNGNKPVCIDANDLISFVSGKHMSQPTSTSQANSQQPNPQQAERNSPSGREEQPKPDRVVKTKTDRVQTKTDRAQTKPDRATQTNTSM